MGERYNNIIDFDELSSTNDYAMDLLHREIVLEYTIIKTNFQTKGRGQIGNHWVSDKNKNLLFSLILHPKQIQASHQFIISQCVSLALCKVVSNYCENVSIKWPNDIYVGNKKIAGILIENLLKGKEIESSIIGVGLNVNQSEFEGAPNPTSIKNECGLAIDVNELLQCFLYLFDSYYQKLHENKKIIQESYLSNLYLLHELSMFRDSGGLFKGKINSVASDGKMEVVDLDGVPRSYYFKEIEYVF